MTIKFPDSFLWGSATSAHQIEGNNHNDWSVWEQSASRLEQLKAEGKNPADFISGRACDGYDRYREDADLAKKLRHTAYRFSIEWSRIEPREGEFDSSAMQHYVDVVKELREKGIEPIITLWHFTNPVWFSVKGGFLNERGPELYKRFISYVVDNLKDRVGLWITFNEATTVYAGLSYVRGIWPPQEKSIWKWWKFRKNILRAHTLAYREIKNAYRRWPETAQTDSDDMSHNIKPLVGLVENHLHIVGSPFLTKLGIVEFGHQILNAWIWSKILPHLDFIGLNYYTIKRFPGSYKTLPKQSEIHEMGWEIYPEGIYHELMHLKKYNKPVFITENGISDGNDSRRAAFIRDHLQWIYKAINDGVDVRGYLYWSLIDNFEWAKGFQPRFGLVEVNRETMERTIRPSALEYATIIKENQLKIDT